MVNLLRKIFIKDYTNTKNEAVRIAHGKLAAMIGIISNLLLFCIKLIIGILLFSVSIIADAINNLFDMATSIATIVGFHFAGKPADKEHPFGHERIEYITGLIISLIILFVGGIVGFTSVLKIINYKPEEVNYLLTYISIGVLAFAILLKIFQFYCYRTIAKIINSVALKATSTDSLNDCITTGVVLAGTIVILILSKQNIEIPFSLDGALGVFVALFIIISGIKLLKEEINPLIGMPISKDYIKQINNYIKRYKVVLGTHDIICHMYGPTKCFMTIHVEVDSKGDIIEIHDKIDEIETSVAEKFNVNLTIHMDPVIIGDPEIDNIKEIVNKYLFSINPMLKSHDLRVVKKNISTVIFDIEIEYDDVLDVADLESKIQAELYDKTGNKYSVIINIDHSYTD